LASFSLSLALCNELEPIKIIQDLQFDDLREENLVVSDYFTCSKPVKSKKFDLVIGNPPFIRSATSNYSDFWIINGKKIEIPQKQLALKFLAEAFSNLRNNGLICLIMKSSSLLYNNTNTSTAYKKNLFLNFNVVQILDFTALAEGKSLWDNGARVGAAAIFIRNEKPDNNINVLHLIFRRAKTIKERIFFEIDDNDFHYVNRLSAVNNKYIWKINLFGGGRIKNIIAKTKSIQTLKAFLDKNNCIIEEGLKIRKSIEEDINIEDSDDESSDYIYAIPFLPTQAISEGKIKYEMLATMDRQIKFKRLPDKNAFFAPNLIMWENIGERQFPIFFNKVSFSFKQSLISIKSLENDENILKTILNSFRAHYLFYKFYFLVTSSQTLVNRNNTFLLKDIKRIPFINCDDENIFSETDMRLMKECIHYFQNFLVHGEKSEILHHIGQEEFESTLNNYAAEFVNSLNTIYKTDKRKFRFSDLVKFDNDLIAVVFRYDTVNDDVKIHKDLGTLKIEGLTNNRISSALTSIRTIKLYPQKDMVVLVKPNQYRYWLTLAACRDADKCASDFADAGF
jgi:hypothetical protein